ncbi:MAG TPA: hypothetical protein VH877_22555 [Polyangia bacterium]|nr:hypothetical protein [Polyangia bacterium]
MESQVPRQMIELGNHYAANQQWNNAGGVFTQALDSLYKSLRDEILVPSESELHRELRLLLASESSESRTSQGKKDDEVIVLDKEPLFVHLREHILQHRQVRDFLDARFVTVFSFVNTARTARYMTIVFYNGDKVPCSEESQEELAPFSVLPHKKSFSFVLRLEDRIVRLWKMTKAEAKQIAYAWAHLGQADVNSAIGLYYVAQVLSDQGESAILTTARCYQRALLLNPQYAWALAHLGEAFRMLANGWPGTDEHLRLPRKRIYWYNRALVYLHNATQQDPRSFWALAHLGATIVNARCFISIILDHADPQQDLLNCWKDQNHIEEATPWALINYGLKILVLALELQGYYYPWAQAYYAGALLLKTSMFGKFGKDLDGDRGKDLGLLALNEALNALYLDPSLLKSASEPGQLYVNPYFEQGLIFFFLGKYTLAWQYVWIGMKWVFKYNFQPGLQSLAGCQILVIIAYKYIIQATPSTVPLPSECPALIDDSRLGKTYDLGFEIPKTPIHTWDKLAVFIESAFNACCEPSVNVLLVPRVRLDTNVRMGLASTMGILYCFEVVLSQLNDSARAGHLCRKIKDLNRRIANKLHLYFNGDDLEPPGSHQHEAFVLGSLLSLIETGKPSFGLAQRLCPKRHQGDQDQATDSR